MGLLNQISNFSTTGSFIEGTSPVDSRMGVHFVGDLYNESLWQTEDAQGTMHYTKPYAGLFTMIVGTPEPINITISNLDILNKYYPFKIGNTTYTSTNPYKLIGGSVTITKSVELERGSLYYNQNGEFNGWKRLAGDIYIEEKINEALTSIVTYKGAVPALSEGVKEIPTPDSAQTGDMYIYTLNTPATVVSKITQTINEDTKEYEYTEITSNVELGDFIIWHCQNFEETNDNTTTIVPMWHADVVSRNFDIVKGQINNEENSLYVTTKSYVDEAISGASFELEWVLIS